MMDIGCHSSKGIQEACSYLHSEGQSTANVKGVLTSWTRFAIRTGSGERQNVVNLDWIIIHLRNKSVVLCVLCAALPARPGFPGSPADLYGGGT